MEGKRKKIISVSLDEETIEQIDKLARRERRSRSHMIQLILDAYLDAEGERAARRREQKQEAYRKEYTDEEAREVFYQAVKEFRQFDAIFQEMRNYQHINEKVLFVTLYNEGWVKYNERFNTIKLSGPLVEEGGKMVRRHTKMPPVFAKRIEDFPFQY